MEHQGRADFNPVIGIIMSGLVLCTWAVLQIYALFFHDPNTAPIWMTGGIIFTLIWLYTGIFIVAHDTMHGSLFPGRPKLNRALGKFILFFYAGFNWDHLQKAHMDHHDFPGTAKDPDFNPNDPKAFWPWYFRFFTTYFSWMQVAILFGFTLIYMFVFGASYLNILILWALPSILSSVQLFFFGTFLTHRHADAFPDHHNARSNDYPAWLSLLTCFHFGYHHEHHLYPGVPWWRLPAVKRSQQ